MTVIAPMSSTIASVSRNSRSWSGHRGPNRASTPTRNAVSVDITTPQPCAASPLWFTSRYSSAGTVRPPMAPSAGTAIARGSRRSPTVASREISRPTTTKNTAIAASLTHWCRSSSTPAPPRWNPAVVDQRRAYDPGERFAHTSAITVAASSRTAPPASVDKNVRTDGASRGRWTRACGPGRAESFTITPRRQTRRVP